MSQEQAATKYSRSPRPGGGRNFEPSGFRSWVSAGLGACILIVSGFLLGIGLGVVAEEPKLVASHLIGQSEEVVWEPGTPGDVAAPPRVAALAPTEATSSDSPAARASQSPSSESSEPQSARLAPPVSSPPTATAPATRAASATPGWTVQVGAFSSSRAADVLVDSLTAKGFETYLKPSSASADGRWRVRVGSLASEGDAQRLARRLQNEESLSTWVLSEGGG